MNQRLMLNIEKDVNGTVANLNLPIGAPWADALAAIKEINIKVQELAVQNTQEQIKENDQPEQPDQDNQPIEQEVIAQ